MSQSRRPVIAGNWKMNGLHEDGLALAKAVAAQAQQFDCDIVVCPPSTLLREIASVTADTGLGVGAQDCHQAANGAFTGDISAEMVRDTGATYAIIGHSERREYHNETDEIVKAKVKAAHTAGLVAIVCVGETEGQRDSGQTMSVIADQIEGGLPDTADAENIIIAFEPVWAIGTGRTASPEDAQEIHQHIRTVVSDRLGSAVGEAMRVLYGGSMKPANAADLLAQPDIDGGLIGGASLKSSDFLAIAEAVSK